MSAWIVSNDHLDLLLTAALAWDLINPAAADDTGRTLWRENLASVAYRYPADRDGERPGPADFRDRDVDTYRFQRYPGRVDPEVVVAAASSLAYQSCERPPGMPAPRATGSPACTSRPPCASPPTSPSTGRWTPTARPAANTAGTS
jgi:hypothetical protein